MEIMVGPTFAIDVSAPYVRERAQDEVSPCLFVAEEEEEVGGLREGMGSGLGFGSSGKLPEESSESSSSIGAAGDSDGEEEEDGAVSSKEDGAMASLSSLEDSLPIKRGLSNHYSGKSKSFANLTEVSSVKELEKIENPFNKRRRVLMANKWCSRKSCFYSWQNPKSMPLLALNEEEDQDGVDRLAQLSSPSPSSSSDKEGRRGSSLKPKMKSQSCFSLADLQEEDQY